MPMTGDTNAVEVEQAELLSQSDGAVNAEPWLSSVEAARQGFTPSTPWKYSGEATWRFLERQQRRAQRGLGLEAVIVRHASGRLALWTREPVPH